MQTRTEILELVLWDLHEHDKQHEFFSTKEIFSLLSTYSSVLLTSSQLASDWKKLCEEDLDKHPELFVSRSNQDSNDKEWSLVDKITPPELRHPV